MSQTSYTLHMGVFQKNSFFHIEKKIEKKYFALQERGVVPQGGLHGGVVPQGGLHGGCRARKKKSSRKNRDFFLALIDL